MIMLASEKHGSARLIRLEDPARRNILSRDLAERLASAVEEASNDPNTKAIVITGAAPAFCAGAKLEDLEAAAAGDQEALHAVYAAFMAVAESPLPTIAAVNGAAVGAGLNLALACDIRLASTTATFESRFLKLGIHPGGGHGWILQRAVGWSNACRMLLLNQRIDCEEAHAIGLVQKVLAADDLVPAALTLARSTESLPRELILSAKHSLRLSASQDHASSFDQEAAAQMESLLEPPFQTLVARLKDEISGR